jgi:para-nitrobenzyl esterase
MTDEPVARTALGDLRGVFTNGVATFRGVPFAAPPIGEHRFARAAPVAAWHGLRAATRHGPIAPQLPSRLRAAMGDFVRPQDEDCLTLTICTPAPDRRARPVLVWLHGGAWISGAGSLDWYDGSRLAREGDLVFVGVNYRLGALGWLHRPGIVDVEGGTSDMIAALEWVRDHIAAFGGDAARVTVMGQSAGATSIGRLLTLPDARDLFRRVIMQSSGFGRGALTSAVATERADQFLRLLAIDPQAGDAVTRLRAAEIPRLLQAQAELARANARFAQTMPMFMPVLPSPMMQAEMLDAIAAGADGKEVLLGATADEVHAFFAADPAMEAPAADAVVARFGGEATLARYRARRPGASALDLLADLATDETFLMPAMHLAKALAAHGNGAHAYLFDWAPPGSRFWSCHCIDLPFVFGNFDAWRDAAMLAGGDAAQMADLSAAMRRAWIAFVRTGDPAHDGLPAWPRHEAEKGQTMRFGARIGVVGDPAGILAKRA